MIPRRLLAILLTSVFGCGGEVVNEIVPAGRLADVTTTEWEALASRRVFFGHQSVGGNIAQGLAEVLAAHPEIKVPVVEAREIAPQASGFYHFRIGENEKPGTKVDEFVQIATRDLATRGSVGMVKLCYVDVHSSTDAQVVFDEYRRKIESLRAANPGLTVVHFTMPLFADEGLVRYWKNRIRGYDNRERDRNVVRNRYNDLLREAYAGKEPVFDIAALESRRADGSRSYFRRWGRKIYTLAPEMTHDGGHLGEAARKQVAEQLLVFLAKLPAPSVAPAATAS